VVVAVVVAAAVVVVAVMLTVLNSYSILQIHILHDVCFETIRYVEIFKFIS